MRIINLTPETKDNILENLLKRSPNQYEQYKDTVNDYSGGSRGNNFANLNDNSGIFSVPR